MKRLVFFFILFFSLMPCSNRAYSQKSGQVEYQLYTHKGVNVIHKGVLKYNDSLSIFISDAVLNGFIEFLFIDSLNEKNNKKLMFFGARKNPYKQIIDLNNQMILSEQKFLDSTYVTVEPTSLFDWKLSHETKNILGYACSSATSSFRGRQYKVWYTEAVPVSFGPWKTHGLSGLILEVQIDGGLFKMVATSIDTTQFYRIEEKELIRNIRILPIQEYLIKREFYFNSFIEMMKRKIPDNYSIVINLDDNLELFQ
ncbi:MAG: GLPGLI family protein [bacterium]